MSRRAGFALAAVLLLAAVPVRPAAACSVVRGYRVPTVLDLTATADVIVVARVGGERRSGDPFGSVVFATPETLVKGTALPPRIELRGAYLATDSTLVRLSDPRELRRPNPDALAGGCVRYTFLPGMRLLLFLKRDDKGVLTPYRAPFSRDAEDVVGPDALWVRAVQEYVPIAVLPADRRPAALRRRIAALERVGTPDARAIAADMRVELAPRRAARDD